MLTWALGFFFLALVAAVLGFGGIAAGAAAIAQFLFYLFVIAFVFMLIVGLTRRGGTVNRITTERPQPPQESRP